MISAPEAFKRLSEYLNRKTEQEENLQESPIVFADNYEENLFRRIHEFNEILEYLKKTYRHYDFYICTKSNYTSAINVETDIDENLNKCFKRAAIKWYERELKKTREKLKAFLEEKI